MSNQNNNRSRFPSLVIGALVIVGLLVAAVTVGFSLFGTPFTTEKVDHSPPPILLDLRDLADYHAAQAQFEVTVDEEDDVQWLPAFIAGERVQFVAIGTVDAIVDFTNLPTSALQQSEDRTSVTITLPALADGVKARLSAYNAFDRRLAVPAGPEFEQTVLTQPRRSVWLNLEASFQ